LLRRVGRHASILFSYGEIVNTGKTVQYRTKDHEPAVLSQSRHPSRRDLANLILYGKANPVDAIGLLGPYVQGIHAKDGLWPTDPQRLGEEVPIGKGKVDFPRIIARLKEVDYRGAAAKFPAPGGWKMCTQRRYTWKN
jgi:hypothetical protein